MIEMVAENQVDQLHTKSEIVATGVGFEEFLEKYAADFCELEYGTVIKMSPIHEMHDKLVRYLAMLLEAFFALKPIGQIRQEPFVMKSRVDLPAREPDIQVILNNNTGQLHPTYMQGPADICIEVVSPGSVEHDRGTKFSEYQKGGVGEYWIMDSLHRECLFYRLNEDGIYLPLPIDQDGNFRSPSLPGLVLHIPTLWQSPLPDLFAIGESVKAMLSTTNN
jgi:Uma2 family endonuclease